MESSEAVAPSLAHSLFPSPHARHVQAHAVHQEAPAHQDMAPHATDLSLHPHPPTRVTEKDYQARHPEPIAQDEFVDLKAIGSAIQDTNAGAAGGGSERTLRRLDTAEGRSEGEGESSPGSGDDSSTEYSDASDELSESGSDSSPSGRRKARKNAKLAREKEAATLKALKAKVAESMAQHEKLTQRCAMDDADMALLRKRVEQARAICSAAEAKNEHLKAELSRLKELANK